MTIELSTAEARRLLVAYHFAPTDIHGVFQRLGTVQYDPLNPIGRNPDLVLQARVPGYRVDDWQAYAYTERGAFDAWDKQACLVPMGDWSARAYARRHYQPWHDRSVLNEHREATEAALREIDERGPLSSLEFSDRSVMTGSHSWYGPTRIKRILRALWADGTLLTHHRQAGRHYYDRAARVVPPEHFEQSPLSAEQYHRWIVERRHQAAGLLRPGAEAAIWSACGDRTARTDAITALVESGRLVPVDVARKRHHAHPSALAAMEETESRDDVVVLGPLDSFLWDRRALRDLFNFDYAWEVYKPETARRWGYYVVPLLQGDRFVGRMDARAAQGALLLERWWWEDGVRVDDSLLAQVGEALARFARYLGVQAVVAGPGLDAAAKSAIPPGLFSVEGLVVGWDTTHTR